jgi:hypothetical protein
MTGARSIRPSNEHGGLARAVADRRWRRQARKPCQAAISSRALVARTRHLHGLQGIGIFVTRSRSLLRCPVQLCALFQQGNDRLEDRAILTAPNGQSYSMQHRCVICNTISTKSLEVTMLGRLWTRNNSRTSRAIACLITLGFLATVAPACDTDYRGRQSQVITVAISPSSSEPALRELAKTSASPTGRSPRRCFWQRDPANQSTT